MRRRAAALGLLASVGLSGCLGSTPTPDKVKSAARSWAQSHLPPGTLEVTLVSVAADQRRARVVVRADGAAHHLRLRLAGGNWRVTRADPPPAPR